MEQVEIEANRRERVVAPAGHLNQAAATESETVAVGERVGKDGR
jgi:hypothetical protein